MQERRRSEWYDRGGQSSFFRRKMRPPSGMSPYPFRSRGRRIPSPVRSRFAGPSGNPPGRASVRSLTKQTAGKAPSLADCSKIGPSQRCVSWHRRPSYGLRRAPCDHLDFATTRPAEDLFRGFLAARAGERGAKLVNSRNFLPDSRLFHRFPTLSPCHYDVTRRLF
jgi:hypothetical protein